MRSSLGDDGTERCFAACHPDEVAEPMLKKYLRHELFVMFGISILTARLNKNEESDSAVVDMWKRCIAFDEKWGKHFRYRTPLSLICIPGRFGRSFSVFIYRFANKIVRFN